MNPDVLLLDEITSALSPDLVKEVVEIIFDLAQEGKTMVVVTHDIPFAKTIAHKIALLHNGSIVEEGIPEQVLESPTHEATKSFLARVTAFVR